MILRVQLFADMLEALPDAKIVMDGGLNTIALDEACSGVKSSR